MAVQERFLNYQHLYYFWRVAAAGSVSEAAKELRLAQPTVSSQLKTLEGNLGEDLFHRERRSFSLTEAGKIAYRYAGEIFSLGKDFVDALEGHSPEAVSVLHVGIADVLPKLLMYKLIQPVIESGKHRVVVYENRPERLLAELSMRQLDLVISDTPLSASLHGKTQSHFLGESGVSFFATPGLAKKYRKNFPHSLDQAPVLIPTESSNLRRSLDHWYNELEIRPDVVGEFEDSSLLKLFARRGHGVFVAASIIEDDIAEETGMEVIGHVDSIRERFYAITTESKVENAAVAAISKSAEELIFS